MLDTGRKGPDNAEPSYAHKEKLTIRYSSANAPQIERHGVIQDEELVANKVKPKGSKL
jgi:hypothetical protein